MPSGDFGTNAKEHDGELSEAVLGDEEIPEEDSWSHDFLGELWVIWSDEIVEKERLNGISLFASDLEILAK